MSNVIVGGIAGATTAFILVERLKSELSGMVKFKEVTIKESVNGDVTLWSGSVNVAFIEVADDGNPGVTVCVNGSVCVGYGEQGFGVYTGNVIITASGQGSTPTVKVVYV